MSINLETLAQAQQADSFWADGTSLAVQAGPMPVVTVSGCISDLAQQAAAFSSVSLVVANPFRPLVANADERGFFELRVPADKIGDTVPTNTTLTAISSGGEVKSMAIDLSSGTQAIDFIVGETNPSGTTYSLVDLGLNFLPMDLNDNDQVLGFIFTPPDGISFELLGISGDTVNRTPLGSLPPVAPNALNNMGTVVGFMLEGEEPVFTTTAFARLANGTTQDLPFLTQTDEIVLKDRDGGDSFTVMTTRSNLAAGVNTAGNVVGTSAHQKDLDGFWPLDIESTSRATIWKSGVPEDLGTLFSTDPNTQELSTILGSGTSDALAINDDDTVVGVSLNIDFLFEATLWRDGAPPQGLGLVNGLESSAIAINNNDWIVGQLVNNFDNPYFPFLWINEVVTMLPSPLEQAEASKVNNLNQVVGVSYPDEDADTLEGIGVLWEFNALASLFLGNQPEHSPVTWTAITVAH
jgi:uncharacterized membrane protein